MIDSATVLKYNILWFKGCGVWPSDQPSILYKIYTVFVLVFVFFSFPLSMFMCVFFVDSVTEMVDHLLGTLTLWQVGIKGFNVYLKKAKLMELLNMLKRMDHHVVTASDKAIFEPTMWAARFFFKLFCVSYSCVYIVLVLNAILRPYNAVLWKSTKLFPSDLAHDPYVYLTVLTYQALSNGHLLFVCISVDTYGLFLNNILCAHLDVLRHRLRNLGYPPIENGLPIKSAEHQLLECVQYYKLCIRFVATAYPNHALIIPFCFPVTRCSCRTL